VTTVASVAGMNRRRSSGLAPNLPDYLGQSDSQGRGGLDVRRAAWGGPKGRRRASCPAALGSRGNPQTRR